MRAPAQPAPTRLWTADTWPFILSLLGLMTFIAFESFAVTTILPVAMSDLGGPEWYSFAYSATITAGLVGMIVGGNWTDQAGPRRPLIVGATLFLVGLALCAAAPNAATFIIGRLLQGLGGGIDSVVLYVLIAQRIPEAGRPKMFGMLTAAWLVPSMAGPVIAGALTDLTSWRTVFAMILAGTVVALLSLLRVTPPGRAQSAAVPSDSATTVLGRRGVLAVVAAAILIVLHLGSQLATPTSSIVVAAALVILIPVAGALLPAGTLMLRGTPQRLITLRAILGATVTATDLYLTLYLQAERGFTPTAAGLVIAVGAGGWAVGAWLQGRFASEQTINSLLILVATPLVVAGPTSAALLIINAVPLPVVVVSCIAMGVGMGIAYPRISSATLALARANEQGAYSSGLQAGESMAVAATTAITAAILTSSTSSDSGFTLIYVLLISTGALAVLVAARGRPVAAEGPGY